MPSPTFFNLPEAKRQRLMNAVWQEFTTVSYMDASINRIIQAAGISRGSFYQYFSGKQEVFSYVLRSIAEKISEMFLAQLTAHNNDLFNAILGVYELVLWKKSRSRQDSPMEQLQTLVRLNAELDMSQFTDQLDSNIMAQHLTQLMLQAGYRMETELESVALVHMLATVTLSNLTDTMRHPNKADRNRRILEQQLSMLRQSLIHRKVEIAP